MPGAALDNIVMCKSTRLFFLPHTVKAASRDKLVSLSFGNTDIFTRS